MSGAAIGSFLQNFMGGMEARQRWDRQKKYNAWDEEDRVLAKEDRARRIKREDADDAWTKDSRDNQRGNWAEQDELHARDVARAAADDAWTKGRRDRTLALEGREDEEHRRAEEERDALAQAYETSKAPTPEAVPPFSPPKTQPVEPERLRPVSPETIPATEIKARDLSGLRGDRSRRRGVDKPTTTAQAVGTGRSLGVTPAQAATADPVVAKASDAAAEQAADAAPSAQDAQDAVADTVRRVDLRSADNETIIKAGHRASQDAYDRFLERGAPQMVDFYLSRGEVDKARQFKEFVEDEGTRTAIGYWTKAQFAAAIGDERGFIRHMASAYNTKGYYDDGYELVANKSGLVRDEGGRPVGAQLTFRDTQTGETFVRQIEGEEDFYAIGVGMLSPEAVFENYARQVEAVQKARAETAKNLRELGVKMKKDEWSTYFKLLGEAMKNVPPGMEPDYEKMATDVLKALRTGSAALSDKSDAAGSAAARVPVATRP